MQQPLIKSTYGRYLDVLRRASVLFSHTLETFGLPFMESLQMGIPVAGFREHLHPSFFRDFHNSIQCGLNEPSQYCADRIVEFFNTKWTDQKWREIREESKQLFSVNSFAERIVETLMWQQKMRITL